MHTGIKGSVLFGLAATLPLYSLSGASPVDDLTAWLKSDWSVRPPIESQTFANIPLSATECDRAKALLWADRTAFVQAQWSGQWTAKRLINKDNLQMPFDYRIYGSKPVAGYDLYISMHGGGSVPAATNDEQWQNQIVLYHPPGIYLAPRAPTDAWNMWHKDHIDGFFDRIIQLCVANLGANPNRVYLMGYSAGGDGVYQMAPRMADRWAAAAMMAGYPNGASPINLRNIGYTMHVGALDSAYNRNTIAVDYAKQIQALQDADPGFYKYSLQVHAGKGHWMDLEDTVALPWMAAFTRKPNPRKVVWHQDPVVDANQTPAEKQFYWIALAKDTLSPPLATITAEIKNQEIAIANSNVDSLVVLLNDSLLNLDKPVSVVWKGNPIFSGLVPRTLSTLYRTIQNRGDRDISYPAKLVLSLSSATFSKSHDANRSGVEIKSMGRFLQIRIGAEHAQGWVRISDLSGKTRRSAALEAGTPLSIPFDHLDAGVYLATVSSRNLNVTEKFVIP